MDHYEAIGVSPNASEAVVRVAYRQRLKESHPDRGNTDPAELDKVLAAGAVLLNEGARAHYDLTLKNDAISLATSEQTIKLRRKRVAAGVFVIAIAAIALLLTSPWATNNAASSPLVASAALAIPETEEEPASIPETASETGDELSDEADNPPAAATEVTQATEITIATPTPVAESKPTSELVPTDAADEDPEVDSATDAEAAQDAGDAAAETAEAEADEVLGAQLPALADLPERGAIYRPPTLFLVGPVPTQAMADAFYAKAVAVLGEENVVNEYVVHPDASTDINGNVRVEQAITFETASAVIRPEFAPVLGLAREVLLQNPQASLVIEGHTDSDGADESNQVLSEARAAAVATWLAERGIEPARLSSIGYGESLPIADNETAEGRTLNRRIEVQIIDLLS